MSYFFLFSVWFLISSLAEYLLVLTPETIPALYKRGIYYLIVWPYIVVTKLKGWLGGKSLGLARPH